MSNSTRSDLTIPIMSTPRGGGTASAVEQKKRGLSKYVLRIKSLLKRGDGSKGSSPSSRTPVVDTTPTPAEPAELRYE